MPSVFDMFYIGIGPSSSHTIGPMRAANTFMAQLKESNLISQIGSINVELYGSLAHTGVGHGTDRAIIIGLEGHRPETVDPDYLSSRFMEIEKTQILQLDDKHAVSFTEDDFVYHYNQTLPFHTNALTLTAFDQSKNILLKKTYYSIGGGVIVENEKEAERAVVGRHAEYPYPFHTAAKMMGICEKNNMKICEMMLENEKVYHPEGVISEKLLTIAEVMRGSIERGCRIKGELPGGLGIKRRGSILYEKLENIDCGCNKESSSFCQCVDAGINCHISAWALAVAEENAAGGRIVVAPTCGSAGILPAVIKYYETYCQQHDPEKVKEFLLTAAAIELLYKKQASISGAEVGCQGEVGVACSMAAAGLTAVLGGSIKQIENAAEIGIEHHLGLTCDPIKGLVQVPCIERNVVGALQAINIAHLVLSESGEHMVSLDKAILTMKQTGFDMSSKYKETALGGLAVNIPNC